jgi:hypothetical protein
MSEINITELIDTLEERANEAERTDKTVSHDTVMRKARDIISKSYRLVTASEI